MRIVITGGHLTPAYSFAEVAVANHDQLLMIGALKATSIEATEMSQLQVNYKSIACVKFDRYRPIQSLLKLPLILYSIFQSLRVLRNFKPDVVVSFGSYIATPVHIAAWLLGIPSVIHEQTRSVGLANRINSFFSDVCCISYTESADYFPSKKTKYVGNLLRKSIWESPDKPSFSLPSTKPIIYVTGGNQGSKAILESIQEIIPELEHQYQFIIQQGNQQVLLKLVNQTVAKPWFSVTDTSWLLHHAYLVISRAGANTTAELMVSGVPSILIPLPKTSQNEQYQNALKLHTKNAAILIPQNELSPSRLKTAIQEIDQKYEWFKDNLKQLSKDQQKDAVIYFYKIVESVRNI